MENQELFDKVFSNHYIVQSILSFNQDDIVKSYIEKRIVNKAFNEAWLVVIREEYREMEIEFNQKKVTSPDAVRRHFLLPWQDTFHINRRKIKKNQLSNFLSFLKTIGVKVEECRVRNGWKLREKMRVHDEIHGLLVENPRKLIGLEEMCNGCAKCLEMAKSACEYGPFGIKSSMKLGKTLHSRTLIINDRFLQELANESVLKGNPTRDACLRKLDGLINPLISVETLVLWISETQRCKEIFETSIPYPIPVEVLKKIIQKWGVKSIRIVLQVNLRLYYIKDEWSKVYTKFRFTDPNLKESFGIPMEHIEIDMSESYNCHRELCEPRRFRHNGYANLIGNTRKLFATGSISITKLFVDHFGLDPNQNMFSSILSIIKKERHLNLTITMQYFITISEFDYFSESSVNRPNEYMLSSKGFCTYCRPIRAIRDVRYFPMRKWIGERYKIRDKEEGFQFNLDVYLPEHYFPKKVRKQKMEWFL
ncbi:unnamed protein product [Caenorhabditis brenneri]